MSRIPEMVRCPAGNFLMGSPEDEPGRLAVEGPQHAVRIAQPFEVGKFVVTVSEFAAFVAASGHDIGSRTMTWTGSDWAEAIASFREPGFEQSERHPAVCVSWQDAATYTQWLSAETGSTYRLMTEAEWEYVARAGTTTPFCWGWSVTPNQANYNATTPVYGPDGVSGPWRQRTTAVDHFAPNPWGLYQVHGNVWEWVADSYTDSFRDAPADGVPFESSGRTLRVLRGGSWLNGAKGVRAARRHGAKPDLRRSDIGFRVVRSL